MTNGRSRACAAGLLVAFLRLAVETAGAADDATTRVVVRLAERIEPSAGLLMHRPLTTGFDRHNHTMAMILRIADHGDGSTAQGLLQLERTLRLRGLQDVVRKEVWGACLSGLVRLRERHVADATTGLEERLTAWLTDLGSSDQHTVRIALEGIALLGDEKAVEPVLRFARRRGCPLAEQAIATLSRFSSWTSADALFELSSAAGSPGLAAAIALGTRSDSRCVPRLVSTFRESSSPLARRIALEGLARFTPMHPELVSLVRTAAEDRCFVVRATAARLLGDLKDEPSVPLLQQTTTDRSLSVRLRSVHAACGIGSAKAQQVLQSVAGLHADPVTREAADRLLTQPDAPPAPRHVRLVMEEETKGVASE